MNDHLEPETREHIEGLIRGLLIAHGDPHEGQPRLFLSTIPEQLPVDLPLPEQTHVLGSPVHSTTALETLLESALPRVELLSFYRTHLTALDWQEPDIPPRYHLGASLQRTSTLRRPTLACTSSPSFMMGVEPALS